MAELTDFADLKYYWTADAGVTLTGSKVSSWVDQVTSTDAVQATDSKRPVVNTGVLADGVSSIGFSGAQSLAVATLTDANTDWTIVAAYDPGTDWSTIYQYLFDSESGRMICAATEKRANRTGFYTDSDGWTTGDWIEGPQILSVTADATAGTAVVRINGREVNSLDYTGTDFGGVFAIGSSNSGTGGFFKGDIGQLAIFNDVLTDDELELAEGLTANDCGMLEYLAADHTYTAARFPYSDWGYSVGPTYQALIERVANGQERRTRLDDEMGQAFSLSFENMSQDELSDVLAWFMVHYGQGYSFRYKDWRDFELDEEYCSGSGSSWQLVKRYSSGGYSYLRPIIRPVPFSITLSDDDGAIDEDEFSIDYSTGIVTFTTDPNGRVKASGEFDCLVRLASDSFGGVFQPGDLASIADLQMQEVKR